MLKQVQEHHQRLFELLGQSSMSSWAEYLQVQIDEKYARANHGNLPEWFAILDELPVFANKAVEWGDGLRFTGNFVDDNGLSVTHDLLQQLCPWRKGPFHIDDLHIDTEWHSDWKWQRLQGHIDSLKDRKILDIGCGNGYYLWQMLGQGAALAVGIDPFWLFVIQYWAMHHFAPDALPAWVLPFGVDELPEQLPYFDTVFSMGVLYHRRSPFEHLAQLQELLRPGGQLVLETLIIDGVRGEVLVPSGRYAKMRNVWFIPSALELEAWLKRVGWENIRCVDKTHTSVLEQRSTAWMHFESLPDFLDPQDSSKTIEGYPAPLRAVFIAEKA